MITTLISKLFQRWLEGADPEKIRNGVYLVQAGIGALIIGALIWLRNRESPSGFKVRESDRAENGSGRHSPKGIPEQDALAGARLALADARPERRGEPLRLAGISISGPPHEILGVSAQATEGEIKAAYRELMKRYHPDLIGRPGSREWKDAQKIAEAINTAKQKMLSALRGKSV